MDPKLSVKNLYKVFGDDPLSILPIIAQNLSINKQTLLEEYGHVLALRDVNTDIYAGQITVIMGLSGSGKSTLIRHFNRLIEPTKGEMLLDGQNISTMTEAEILHMRQTRMSMVFQKFALFPHYTVLENTGLALTVQGISNAQMKAEVSKWLDRVELSGFEDHYPHQLSGGMQQRVGIARALTSNAEIMLMDEAFSALDPLIRNSMQDLLLRLQSELRKTIIFITHDLDEALKIADKLVILKDGYIVQQGEPQHILLHPNDPYIENFVSAINRGRVLRVCSVMRAIDDTTSKNESDYSGVVDYSDTLEDVIAFAEGDTSRQFLVHQNSIAVGTLKMRHLVKALVPRIPETD